MRAQLTATEAFQLALADSKIQEMGGQNTHAGLMDNFARDTTIQALVNYGVNQKHAEKLALTYSGSARERFKKCVEWVK